MPEQSLSFFGIKSEDTVYVLNFQPQNSFVTHLAYIEDKQKQGALKIKKIPSQVQPLG
jgi:hypothetical protein